MKTQFIRDVTGAVIMVIYTDLHGRHFYDQNGSKVYLPQLVK